ncbi:MAG: MMPL family transporter [Chloroflexi bacterium]|nr:MMPL family transporter [Chloroflexota bacterium]
MGWHWRLLVVWLAGLAVAGALLAPRASQVVKSGGFIVPGSESALANEVLARDFAASPTNTAIAVFHTPGRRVDDPDARGPIVAALARLRSMDRVHAVLSVFDSGDTSLVSSDGTTTLAAVALEGDQSDVEQLVPRLRQELAAVPAEHYLTGVPATNYDAFLTSEEDLRRSELFTIPIAVALLLLVFRTAVSAAVPLVLGASNVVLALAAMAVLGAHIELSVFALNVGSMMGLGLGLDFALIVISRFRAERAAGCDNVDSLARTMSTAGRSITYSGLTVMLSMLAATVLLRDLMIVRSMTLGVALVAAASLLSGLTLLPALLALLGDRLEWLRVLPAAKPEVVGRRGFWYSLSYALMRRPWWWFAACLVLLCALAQPVLRLHLYGATPDILPPETESVTGARLLAESFGSARLEPIQVVAHVRPGGAADSDNLNGLDRLAQLLVEDGRVLATRPIARTSQAALLTVYARSGQYTAEHQALVYDLRQRLIPGIRELRGVEVDVGGDAGYFLDFRDQLYSRFPLIILAVTVMVFVVLCMFFQSVFLPLKAIFMNLVSILATYGVLVLVFQDGVGAGIVGFRPIGSLFVASPVVLYVILFALSSDYEVFMLARVKEQYERTGNNSEAVALGLQETAGVITAAGLILIGTFGSFASASILTLKEIGLGLAVGVLLDATVVRVIMVPVAMRLMGDRNWWMPTWLKRFVPQLHEGPPLATQPGERA